MCKKTFGMLLLGATSLFCSCVDDTYDLANKELSMDVKIAGNKLTLPLGSLRPIVLDSILDLDAISVLEADSVTRTYSISMDSSLMTRVEQENLGVLEEVSNLSAEIAPIVIPLEEISFTLPPYEYNDTVTFAEVELTDVEVDAVNELVDLPIDELVLDPIKIEGEEHPVEFEIPSVELDPVTVPATSTPVEFSVDAITVDDVTSEKKETNLTISVDEIDLSKITAPTFTTEASKLVGDDDETLRGFLSQGDDFPLLMSLPLNLNNTISVNDWVSVGFKYALPKEIKHFNSVVMKAENGAKGALFEFRVKNPALLNGVDRKVSFRIAFPANYDLATCKDNNEKYYTITETSDGTVLEVKEMPAMSETTVIHFYLKGIDNLDADKYYEMVDGDKWLTFTDEVSYKVDYKVNGNVTLPAGTTVAELKKGLSYAISLDAAFDVEEAYGTTNPVKVDFANQDLGIDFPLEDLKYIKRVGTVTLDPAVSKLRFSTHVDNGFGRFDFAPNSKLSLSFPDKFVFATDVKDYHLPDGVTRVGNTNVFEIHSIDVLVKNDEWVLPIRQVNIEQDVTSDGTLNLSATLMTKALSGNQDGFLTIGGEENLPLKESTKMMTGTRKIRFSAEPIELAIKDVTAQVTDIDIPFENESINFEFPVEGNLENVQKVDFVEFDTDLPLKISSVSSKSFGNINFAKGNGIALRFPEKFEFDYTKSTLHYDLGKKAFVIDNLSTLEQGSWTLALKRVTLDQEIQNNVFNVEASIVVEAYNGEGTDGVFYMSAGDEVTLSEIEKQFGDYNITFSLEESPVAVTELQANTNNIDVEFESQEVVQEINLDNLSYVTHIGDITLEEGNNMLMFRTGLKGGGLGRFALAKNSAVDFIFPEQFKLDAAKSSIPDGAEFVDESHIRINSLAALSEDFTWKLAVKRIIIDKEVKNEQFNETFTISIEAHDAQGNAGNLTIAAIEGLTLNEIQQAGGKRKMDVSVLPCEIVIADARASISDIDFDFEKQSFDFGVDIKDLELVDEIKYISFEEGYNKIDLNISVDGILKPFDLADNSGVKITFPKEFKLNQEKSKFGGLNFDDASNALYIDKIDEISNCNISLVLDSIVINKKIENDQFQWNGEIAVAAIDKATGAECEKLYVGGKSDLNLSEVKDVMNDKKVQFTVPETQLRIKEAVIISEMVTHDIEEEIEIPIDERIAEPILRVDSIGFVEAVPLLLKVSTTGLNNVNAPVSLSANIALPPVFNITSGDDKVKVTDKGLEIDMKHNFTESSTIELKLWVNSLDFTGLEEGYLALAEAENGDRVLKYDGKACVEGSVSINNAQLSSTILNEDITMGIAFEMGKVVLKNFTGLYGGTIDPVTESFELGIEDGFAELEKNGLTLVNTKPELMISLDNSIGVPVNVDLSIVGRDKDGNVIPSAVINPGKTLTINPAMSDEQGELVPATTRWIFTSNENRQEPGYEVVVVKNLDSLLNKLPYVIDFDLTPTIVTENVVHRVDLSKPLELGGSYSISVPFDLQFAQSIDLNLGEVADIINNETNNVTLANPQLALSIHNPIAQDLSFDLSLIGKDANGKPISTASLEFDEPFVLAAGHRNADGTITPTPTRWLFAVGDSIQKEGFETKVAPALGTLLNELPRNIDIALNAHFNTDLTTQIDYNNDLELLCEYSVLVPLQFSELRFNYADTIPEIKLNLEETLSGLNLSVGNIGLALNMNLKNTLPVGLTLNLIPLDVNGNVIEDIEIGSIEIPAGDGSAIGTGEGVEATPVELVVSCASSSDLTVLDKISFSLDVATGNGDNVLSGEQGLQISDIVLQIMCDVETGLSK